MKVIILAGGGGTRLFPLSRSNYPKQFLKTFGDCSLLVQSINRFSNMVSPKDIIIVTGQRYAEQVRDELGKNQIIGVHTLLEPEARNTAPAILLAVKYCQDQLNADDYEPLFISTSDHLIRPQHQFEECLQQALVVAKRNKIITFGIKPDRPDTGFGYIAAGEQLWPANNLAAYNVREFREKPNLQTAQEYLNSGNYYWNSGMFVFNMRVFWSELQQHMPDMYDQSQCSYEELLRIFGQMPNISLDYAIAEKSKNVAVLPLTCQWSDVGTWDAVYDAMQKDDSGNVVKGDCLLLDCKNSMFMSNSRLITATGLEDVIVVETDDAIMLSKKGETQKIKNIVDALKHNKRKEVEVPTTIYRPWGSYTVLTTGEHYKIKKISVNPHHKLSLQLHYYRSEHWIVTAGTALVTNADRTIVLEANQSTFIPLATKHRLENPGEVPLDIIEVQSGTYLEEDDIVRFDDLYNRNSSEKFVDGETYE